MGNPLIAVGAGVRNRLGIRLSQALTKICLLLTNACKRVADYSLTSKQKRIATDLPRDTTLITEAP